MITKNDQNILNFLDDFHIATTSQIHRLFFYSKDKRYSRLRLQYLHEKMQVIKRTRSTIDNGFAYFTEKKPAQVHHDLLRAELFVNLNQKYKVVEWSNELPIVNIRPDATGMMSNNSFAYINDHDIVFPVFIEIHLNNKFNFDKYKSLVEKHDLREMFGIMPRVLLLTDREVTIPKDVNIKFKVVDVNMQGLDRLFK